MKETILVKQLANNIAPTTFLDLKISTLFNRKIYSAKKKKFNNV